MLSIQYTHHPFHGQFILQMPIHIAHLMRFVRWLNHTHTHTQSPPQPFGWWKWTIFFYCLLRSCCAATAWSLLFHLFTIACCIRLFKCVLASFVSRLYHFSVAAKLSACIYTTEWCTFHAIREYTYNLFVVLMRIQSASRAHWFEKGMERKSKIAYISMCVCVCVLVCSVIFSFTNEARFVWLCLLHTFVCLSWFNNVLFFASHSIINSIHNNQCNYGHISPFIFILLLFFRSKNKQQQCQTHNIRPTATKRCRKKNESVNIMLRMIIFAAVLCQF